MKPSDLALPDKFVEFRSYPGFDQLSTALELANSDKPYQILNAATGSGKSLTYAAAAKLLSRKPEFAVTGFRWLALVGTKDLQSQLLGDGLVQRLAYSHRNYPCARWYRDQDSQDGPNSDALDFECSVPRDRCGWVADIAAAQAAEGVVCNYAYWLSIGRYSDPDLLGHFDLVVFDEGHTANKWLVDGLAITLTSTRLQRVLGTVYRPSIPRYETIVEYSSWVDKLLEQAFQVSPSSPKEERDLARLIKDLRTLRVAMLVGCKPEKFCSWQIPWVVVPQSDADGGGVKFCPPWGSDFAESLLFRGIERVIITSATVTKFHAARLGIQDSEMSYREVPSPFDYRRRPVVYVPTVRVDHKITDGGKYKLSRRIDQVIEAAVQQGAGGGVLHTGSYDRNAEIVVASKYSPLIITHRQDSKDFKRALEEFKIACLGGRFAVIASPRMQEGIDLPMAYWQVILKMPFPDRRDPLTAARMEYDGYKESVVIEVVQQMSGRIVRSVQDFGLTIVIDDHWSHVRRSEMIAGWFREAFATVKEDDNGGLSGLRFLTKEVVQGFKEERIVTFIR